MTAVLTATIKVKDMDKMMEYVEKATPTLIAAGGEPLLRAPVSKVLRGDADHNFTAAFRFPDVAAVEAWYTSDAYTPLHALRDAAADVTFVVHDEG